MNNLLAIACTALASALLPVPAQAGEASADFRPAHIKLPYAEQRANLAAAAALPATKSSRIKYHHGPVMTAPLNTIYVIWYGSFPVTGAANDTKTVMSDFFAHIGGSPQYNVNSTYYDASNKFIVNALHWDPATTSYDDNYSIGHSPADHQIATIVHNAITNGHLPADDNGVYFVVTSPDATAKLTNTCAWHDGSTTLIPGHAIKYASIPVFGGAALQDCNGNAAIFNEQNSPNDNPGADSAIDAFMHELSEAVTDPLPVSGWTYNTYFENGDLCNFVYGTTYLASNGTHADAHIGNRDYLVQTIWQNTGKGFCANTH